jgi:NAD+ synthase (glutamine-hydrolysing)
VRRFDTLYSHGFARIAAAVPHVKPAEPVFNAERTLALARQASEARAAVVAFPELGLSAYAIDDLLHQQALQDAVLDALETLVAASADLFPMLVVGAPLQAEGGLFNCGVVIHRGAVLGVVPKSYLPEYRE